MNYLYTFSKADDDQMTARFAHVDISSKSPSLYGGRAPYFDKFHVFRLVLGGKSRIRENPPPLMTALLEKCPWNSEILPSIEAYEIFFFGLHEIWRNMKEYSGNRTVSYNVIRVNEQKCLSPLPVYRLTYVKITRRFTRGI